ncbi:MAG: sulfatase-like hydrolase/transferase [Planctomycetales bacterium]|nr:sulfatase-like hydrolase/transferase [Planctomycetales bacterium]
MRIHQHFLVAFLLCIDAASWMQAGERPPPNIVFVLLDNVGKDWIRCYGSQENVTPNIDRLCSSGMKFRNFYVTPVCSTTRTMLLTGRYPFRTGWHTHHDAAIYGGGFLDWNREVTFARLLSDAGYRTCVSGKWQVNDLFDLQQVDALQHHGFHEHCIWPEAKPGLPGHKQRYWDPYILRNGEHIDTHGRFGPDVCTEYSIDFIRRQRDRPFLLYQSAILTHIPVTTTPHAQDANAPPRQKFAEMLRYADHLIGRLVDALDEAGIRDNTLIFIASDNGTDIGTDQGAVESLGGRIHGRISDEGIYSLSENGINMPLIVNCPGWLAHGFESDILTNAADILPTLAELSGAALPEDVTVDGLSFAQVLKDSSDESWMRPWTFTQYSNTRVVRDQRFKLFSDGRLVDLAANPLELTAELPMGDSDTSAQIAARMRLQAVLDSFPPDSQWPWAFRSISARKLRAQADLQRRMQWVEQTHEPPSSLVEFFHSPTSVTRTSIPPSLLHLSNGMHVDSPEQWSRKREEILAYWHSVMGQWPALIETPRFESVDIVRRESVTQRQLRIELGIGHEMVDAFLLVPDGDGPFPAVVVPYYDAQTGAGLGMENRDFGWQLAKRGFVTLSIGKPNSTVDFNDHHQAGHRGQYYGSEGAVISVQPLSALAYAAANAHTFLAQRPEVYPDRIGIVGHSFGGKWSMFAACLYDKFDCAVWSDPGIVWDERDRRKQNPGGSVNYWDEWYLGFDLGKRVDVNSPQPFRRLPSEGQARTGAYKTLVENGHDLTELHALMAPRPFLVSGGTADMPERWTDLQQAIAINQLLGYEHRVAMTNRETHAPTEESNEQIYRFFEWWLLERE